MGKGFRAVFVNHVHPDSKHVSALRMRSFADTLAAQGNEIVLFTQALNPTDAAKPVSQVGRELASHDWTRPYVLACRPESFPLLRRAREGYLVFGLRQGVLASAYFFRSGVFTDWLEGALPYLPILSQDFQPDIIWATFGNTDAWNIARRMAAESGCPWVADLKDNWGAFLPIGLARLIAARYRDAAHMTVFSESHREEADHWFGQDKTVIYSGFNEAAAASPPQQAGAFRILLTGSVYGEASLACFIGGLRAWLAAAPIGNVILSYAGNDGEEVASQAAVLQDHCEINIQDFLPYDELLALQKAASLNVYMRNSRNLFQHKVLELLAAGRPVLSVPGEGREAMRIADRVGGCLLPCDTEQQVFQALQKVSSHALSATDVDKINAYSWPAQSKELTRLFRRLAGGAR
ncbi:MAG: hypothetical protein ISR45_01645 [Rhodospirillales bacterium]|nr:hypothetical protein [Rhodospirillales bacterium]